MTDDRDTGSGQSSEGWPARWGRHAAAVDPDSATNVFDTSPIGLPASLTRGDEHATVLVVATGNVCRSPVVEYALRDRFAATPALAAVAVRSAGINAATGQEICEVAGRVIGSEERAVLFAARHRAHRIEREDLAGAALVLTARREHRGVLARLDPSAQWRVFTWREAITLAQAAEATVASGAAERPADLVAAAELLHSLRGVVPTPEPSTATSPFHWRRAATVQDPLNVSEDAHGPTRTQHQQVVQEARDVGQQLGERLAALLVGSPTPA